MSHKGGDTNNHNPRGLLIPSSQWGEEVSINGESVRENLLEIEKKIAPCKPRIIAVTKYFGLEAILKGYEAGLRNFGESRINDAVKKIESLSVEIRNNSEFHFIGHLQTNKVEKAVKYFDYIHSVDSLKVASAISKAACMLNKKMRVLIQVNNAREEQKSGYEKELLKREFSKLINLEGIEIKGLMNMAPLGASEAELRFLFQDICRFRDELNQIFKVELNEISMGMSDDYAIAVEEGSTMIRIGRKLFS